MIATKTCACGQEIEFEAELAREGCCPACGAPLVEGDNLLPSSVATNVTKPKRGRFGLIPLALGLGVIGALAIGLIGSDALDGVLKKAGNARQAWTEVKTRERLYGAATNAVTQRLKAPRTAIFDGPDAVALSWGEYENYRLLRGYVDSQNGFGALVRMKWEVKFHARNDEVMDVKFAEE
jgi:hypothetical protein